MDQKEDHNKQTIQTILRLFLVFLPISIVANYLNHRDFFVFLHLVIFILTVIEYFKFQKEQKSSKVSEYILYILFILVFAYFLLGEQKSFDILWVLTLPLIAVMTASLQRLKVWLVRTNSIVVVMIIIAYFYPQYVQYELFPLFSLLWAVVFVSYLVYKYKLNQVNLEKKIESYQHSLEQKIEDAISEIEILNHNLIETQSEVLQRLGTLGEYRSKETGAHVKRVGLYTKKLALLAGVSENDAILYERAAPLHDIGKVGIEDAILNKPAKLTFEEFEIMKEHASIGENILSGSNKPMIQIAEQIAGGHHEKYDGSGYPRGLKALNIPLSARIVAIADVFDALYSARVYKKAWSIEEIITHFENEKSKHFDPKLVSLFLDNLSEFVAIYNDNNS